MNHQKTDLWSEYKMAYEQWVVQSQMLRQESGFFMLACSVVATFVAGILMASRPEEGFQLHGLLQIPRSFLIMELVTSVIGLVVAFIWWLSNARANAWIEARAAQIEEIECLLRPMPESQETTREITKNNRPRLFYDSKHVFGFPCLYGKRKPTKPPLILPHFKFPRLGTLHTRRLTVYIVPFTYMLVYRP